MTGNLAGGVPFEIGGAAYTLRFSVNALILLEDRLDTDVQGVMALAGAGRIRDLRTIFWGGLTDCKPDLTEVEAGEIMSAVGIEEAGALMTKALVKAFPSAALVEGGDARPQKAAASRKGGTGKRSTLPGLG